MGTGGSMTSPPDVAPPPPDTAPPPPPPPPPPPDAAEPEVAVDLAPVPDASADTASSLSQGLVSRWLLEEGTGTAVKDVTNTNPGTVSGATWVAGFRNPPSKSALHFDGDNDYVELGTKLPGLNKPQTVAFWFRYTALPENLGIAFSAAATAGTGRLKVGLRAAGVVAMKSSNDAIISAPAPGANTWHHFIWSFDGRTNVIYLDGVEKARNTTAPDNATANAARLGSGHNNAENYSGDLDDVRVYGRALTAPEATALAAGQE
jgi:hypothetical protein